MLISIIVPVYKSSESIKELANQIFELEKGLDFVFELIFVNDSPNFKPTQEALKSINFQYPDVLVINLRKNQGQHIALLVGISKAKGDYIITMDDDLQHPVKEIPRLVNALQGDEDIEVIFALPSYAQKKHSVWRNVASFILNKIDVLFLAKPKGLVKSSFKIFTKEIGRLAVSTHNAMPSLSSIIIKLTDNIVNIEVEHNARVYGKSNYSLSKLISLSLNNILHYSSLPLKMIGVTGVIGLLFSIVFIAITIIRKFFLGITFPGYTSTVSLISFFGGLNLFGIGLIGEYLIRIIKEQQKLDLDDFIKE